MHAAYGLRSIGGKNIGGLEYRSREKMKTRLSERDRGKAQE